MIKKEGKKDDISLEIPPEIEMLFDLGCALPEKFRKVFAMPTCVSQMDLQNHLPIAPAPINALWEEGSNKPVQPEISRIPFFLSMLRPETLICRCSSFGILDEEVFSAILQYENEKRRTVGDSELSTTQLFSRLPPFLQKSDRIISIAQRLAHEEAASHNAGIHTLLDARAAKKQREVE